MSWPVAERARSRMIWLTASSVGVIFSIAAKLDDVLAEIGLDRLDAVRLEMLVEADLLGHHRLALGDGLRPGIAADRQDDLARLFRRLGVMHLPAGSPHLVLVGLEIEVE